jgi:lipopolysaccharide export system permease protein
MSIFSALFAIASIIFLIKLATYTSIIQLSVLDMTKLYIFVIPELLFYTLPITFFVSAALAIFKLSNDNEIVVIFSLGIHPAFIIKTLLKPAAILSLLLMFDFFVVFPHAKTLSKNFIKHKKSEAQFNIAASEYGHKFGDWLMYLGEKDKNGIYYNVFLFNKKANEELLIEAKQAEIINDEGILRLKLIDGEGYSYSTEKFSQVDFKTMYINDKLSSDLIEYRSTIDYWTAEKSRKWKIHMFITDTLLSLFPLLSLFLIVSISVVNSRHQKSKIYLYLFLSIVTFYGLTLALQKVLVFYTIPIIALTWLGFGYLLYKKTIVARF